MTDIYVSNTAVNGIPVGTAGGNGAITDPVLTFAQALALCSGDENIYFNDGTYYTDAGLTSTTAGDILVSGVSILPVTDYGATFKVSTTANQIFRVRITGVTFGKVIIDASSDAARAITDANGPIALLTFNGTHIKGSTTTLPTITLDAIQSITMTGGWILEKTATMNGKMATLAGFTGGGTFNISDGTIKDLYASSADHCLELAIAAASTNVVIHDVDVIVDDSSMGSGETHSCIYISGAATVEAYALTVNSASNITGHTTLLYIANDTLACTSCYVHDITAQLASDNVSDGECSVLIVGSNGSTANDYQITNVIIENIQATGCNHGVLMGWTDAGILRKCKSYKCEIGFVVKGTTNGVITGNIADSCGSHYFLNKQGTDDLFAFNTARVRAGYPGDTIFRSGVGDTATPSTGVLFYNNVLDADVAITKIFDFDDEGTAKWNNIYSAAALPAGCFSYNGTDYDTLSALETAEATIDANTEHDPSLDDDYIIPLTSSASGIGVRFWTTGQYSGYNDPIPSFDIDPGAMQNQNHPFHPTKL